MTETELDKMKSYTFKKVNIEEFDAHVAKYPLAKPGGINQGVWFVYDTSHSNGTGDNIIARVGANGHEIVEDEQPDE